MLHVTVVFIPLAALGLILMAVLPKWGARFGWVVTAAAAVALGFSFVTKESGEQLEKIVGEPGFDHAEWGDRIPIVAGVLFLMTLILWLAQRSWAKKEDGGKGLIIILGVLSVLVAAASMFMVYQAGDTGAKSVWEGEIAADESAATTPSDEASPAQTTAASPAPTSTTTPYTLADVQKHNTSGDCWTVINNTVYNVTAWEDQHPGGAARIIQLCGIDGTSLFDGQHEGEPKPEDILAGYEIGVLN